jgi:hypothetical protein
MTAGAHCFSQRGNFCRDGAFAATTRESVMMQRQQKNQQFTVFRAALVLVMFFVECAFTRRS